MKRTLKILLLEDSNTDAEMIMRLLLKDRSQYEFRVAMDKKNFMASLEDFFPDVILSDNSLPQFDAAEALKITRQRFRHIPFILVTGTVSDEFAANIIKEGADDYILKDRMVRLPTAIDAALNRRKALKEITDYKYALDQSADITITDQKGIIIYANDNFCRLSQFSTEELIGRDHRIINSGYHPSSFFHELWITISRGKIWQGEVCNKAKDGSRYWVDTTIVPFVDEKGNPYQYLAIRKDISEKKKAESELRLTHERLSFHIENTPLGFIEWDRQLRLKYWSKRAEEIFGWTESEFISKQKDGYSQVYEEDMELAAEFANQLLTGQVERNTGQHRNYTKDGRVIWCEWFNSVLRDKNGKVITILSLVQDITSRKKAEEELLQTQKRLKQAQAIAHLGNWEINFESNKGKWSDESYRIFGLEPGDHNPSFEDWLSFVHPDDLDRVKQKIKESETATTDLSFDHRIIRKDGIVRHIYSEAKYEFNKENNPIGLYGITHDITERKEAEDELRKSNERFQYATQAASDIIWELNFETKEYKVYEGKEKLFGINKKLDWQIGIEGKYIVEEDRERIRNSFRDARMDPSRELWEAEYRVYSMENTIVYLINHAAFIRDKNGKAIRAVGAMTDITEKKKLEADLLEQQRQEQLKITATTLAAQEKERNAIGQELHDNVNQILVGTKLLLSMVKTNPPNIQELVNSSINNLQQAIEENRRLAHELATPNLKKETLTDQLDMLTSDMLLVAGIETKIDQVNYQDALLNEDQKLAIYRIAQEQCTNIVKYSKASMVNISLATDGKMFRMIISDNGSGMDSSKKQSGIGLKNINARLSVLNGTVNIITAPGKGFILEVEMPV